MNNKEDNYEGKIIEHNRHKTYFQVCKSRYRNCLKFNSRSMTFQIAHNLFIIYLTAAIFISICMYVGSEYVNSNLVTKIFNTTETEIMVDF
jgi:hypothetical protein